MSLSRSQFHVLAFLEREGDKSRLTQRNIARATGLSTGTVNKMLTSASKYFYGGIHRAFNYQVTA
jgi:DNA-binding MarR family transcriptional regulator